MVFIGSLGNLIVDRMLQYYKTVLNIDDRAFTYWYIYIYIRGSLNEIPDFFLMGNFIDSTHMKI